MNAIIVDKDVWMRSQLSIARFYGGITVDNVRYIVDKQTQDLVREEWLPLYKKYGAPRVRKIVERGVHELKAAIEELDKDMVRKKASEGTQLSLF